MVAGQRPAQLRADFEALTVGTAHDVSIRFAIGAGDRLCVGIVPASNVSMTCMRPPQQGQGLGSVRGSSVRAAAIGSGLGGGGGHLSKARALAMAAARLPLARKPPDQVRGRLRGGCGGSPSAARAAGSAV